MNLPNCFSYLAFLILRGKVGWSLYINLGATLTSNVSDVSSVVAIVVPKVIRLGCLACSPFLLASTKEVVICVIYSSPSVSEDFISFFGWSLFCWLGHSYSLPLLNYMTLHVSMLLVSEVDDSRPFDWKNRGWKI